MGAARRFIVTSPGYTATKWLAWALNEHPAIHCTHSAGVSPTDHAYSLEELDALVEEKFGARDQIPLDQFLTELEADAPDAEAVGNVHRYNLSALARNREHFPGAGAVRVVNLVRHPVDWIASGTAQMARMSEGVELIQRQICGHHERHGELHAAHDFPVHPSNEDLAFAYLCHRLCLLAREGALPGIRHVPMEAMTTERDTFASVVKAVSGRIAEESYLDSVFEKGAIHAHRSGAPASPREKFEGWLPWKRELFAHWARVSEVFSVYRGLGYTGWVPPSVGAGTERVRAFLEGSFHAVTGTEVLMEGQFRKLFSRKRRRIHERLVASVPWAGGWGDGPFGFISPGILGGIEPLPPEALFTDDSMTLAAVHPYKQDRSPAILRLDDTQHLATLNLKGAGMRSPHDTFIGRAGRCPSFVERLRDHGGRPLELLFDHPEEEYNAHRLVGGAEEGAMLYEAWHALGWHALLLELDGDAGALPVPISVSRLGEMASTSREGGRQMTWDYLTDPLRTHRSQMRRLLRDIRWVDAGFNPFAILEREYALRQLKREDGVESMDPDLRRRMAEMYLRFRGPVIYAHASRAKLRIGHLWDQVATTEVLSERLLELGLPPGESGMAEWIRRVLREIHACHGVAFRETSGAGKELASVSGRMALLAHHHEANGDLQSGIMESVGKAAGRTLGALHGAGGHGLGRRLKIRSASGEVLRDEFGMVVRAGAPGGGPTASRNVTIAGEFMDLSMVSNPAMDWTSRFARAWSRVDGRRCQPGHPRLVPVYQACDVELALESMTLFSAFLMGNESLVDPRWQEITEMRRERKVLEDGVRLPDLSSEERAQRIEAVEGIEGTLGELRKGLDGFPPNPTLDAFRVAYDRTFDDARARYPRYAQARPCPAVEETDAIH